MAVVFTAEYLAQRADRQRALATLHMDWARRQVAAGVDGPVPAGRVEGSDYNQHVPDLESSGADMDDFFAQADAIMGLR